ncbi:SRPBCC domain-containing protein [uncultured Polaribacter sp.]|uniref:SRPBCC family protein n=1 Tax=uncultured Polaribacter sp. TaxID=174711 RepID=UPI00262D5BAA|nr:SRPBCC domain-containing protein [uncultured Polaribacter sp.]
MNAKEHYSIFHDITISAGIDKVFEAITRPEHLVNWWPKKCKGNPNLNAEYNFYFTPAYDWYGTVVKLEKNKSFHIKMTKSDEDWESTSFGFDLEEKNNFVQVNFWHVGWRECNANFRRSSFCWAMLLNGLKNYVEKGKIVPFEERE